MLCLNIVCLQMCMYWVVVIVVFIQDGIVLEGGDFCFMCGLVGDMGGKDWVQYFVLLDCVIEGGDNMVDLVGCDGNVWWDYVCDMGCVGG